MAGDAWWQARASTLRNRIASGEMGAVELTRAALERAAQPSLAPGALLRIDAEGALAQAATIERKRAAGRPLGALAGVPVVVKDNLCTRGLETTCGSKILKGYLPPYDAHAVEGLRRADAVLIGKANMDEFAMGSSTENSAFEIAVNPWDHSRTPGGSSGGSAAAVAAGLAPLALGSDTGGSVRQPGAFCGVYALKPTYGRVSRYGLVAFASSLDQIGPFARDPEDLALLLTAIAGHDDRDATSAKRPDEDYAAALAKTEAKPVVGVLRDASEGGAESEVATAFARSLESLRSMGYRLVDVDLPSAQLAVAIYYIIAPAEASSNLSRFDGVRYGQRIDRGEGLRAMYSRTRGEGFGPEVKRRIMLGTFALSSGYYEAYYARALKARSLVIAEYRKAFAECDVVVSPTTPTPAFRLGEKVDDPLSMYLADVYTLPASLAGLPAMSIPCGHSEQGLPLGLHIAGRPFAENTLLRLAQDFHAAQPLCPSMPPQLAIERTSSTSLAT